MIWTLIISLIIGSSDPIFILPKLDKSVKKYVSDSERKEQLLNLQKESKKHRKEFNKTKKKFTKELKKKSLNTSTTSEELKNLKDQFTIDRKDYFSIETELIVNAKKLFTKKEWELTVANSEKEINSEIKRINKIRKKVENNARKANKLINTNSFSVDDQPDLKSCINDIFDLKKIYIDTYLNILKDKESILYIKHTYPESLNKTIADFHLIYDKTTNKIIEAQLLSKRATTKNQWKKLIKTVGLKN